MDALVIGTASELTAAVTHGLRRQGRSVLQALPADADGPERIDWLLDEAGHPPLVVVFDDQPYRSAHALLAHTHAEVVLVAQYRVGSAGAPHNAPSPWPIGRGLKVVMLGRAGRRWFTLGPRRMKTLSAARAAALIVRACRLPAPAQRAA
jgi:hypothetical protein